MSDICVSNIIPFRTRSGRQPIKPAAEESKQAHSSDNLWGCGQKESGNIVSRSREAFNITVRAKELYNKQYTYVSKTSDRSLKFGLMAECDKLLNDIHTHIQKWKDQSHTIKDIVRWVELICWKTRITVFNQSVCVA